MPFTAWNVFTSIGGICGLLLIGEIIRAKVGWAQRLLPAAAAMPKPSARPAAGIRPPSPRRHGRAEQGEEQSRKWRTHWWLARRQIPMSLWWEAG